MQNILVAQSGGPSPVINASLGGVIDACKNAPQINKIYAAYHGIEGVLQEQLIDIGAEDPKEIALLKTTPCSGVIGTCRYKLQDKQQEDYRRILTVLKAHNIGIFFYIGGNDSMDTAAKVNALAKEQGYPLIVAGIPKTIDNDLGDEAFTIIDHTPGYGSCARYWAHLMQNAYQETLAMHTSECVSVYQAMGRTSGFITAAARLADPGREMPLLLFLSECNHNLDFLAEAVSNTLKQHKKAIVVVNEGFDVGDIGARRDGFGHIEYGASEVSAAQAVTNFLNKKKLPARGQVTCQIPGVIQRGVSTFASTVDIEEAYTVATRAVSTALQGKSGLMATILRDKGATYKAIYDSVPLETVANAARFLPRHWIADNKLDVTDDFIAYARPLIGDAPPEIPYENGLQRFARFKLDFVPQRCEAYTPESLR